MKKILFLCIIAGFWFCISCNSDPYAEVKNFAPSETIYPEKFDTISAAIGFERVEIYLTRAGRSDSIKKNPSKARKTVVEYNDTTVVFEGMKSWVNITGLTLPKLYRFYVYTIDSLGNKSVPLTIAKIPFTRDDRNAIRIVDPNSTLSPWGVKLWWPNGISTDMWKFQNCDYEYRDKDGNTYRGVMDNLAPRMDFDVVNLNPGSEVNIAFTIKILPVVEGQTILDTVSFTQTIDVAIPTTDEYGQFLKSREIEKWDADASQGNIVIKWKPVSDLTMLYTDVTYTDYSNLSSPAERTVRVENNELQTIVPGIAMERIAISSSYEPVGGNGAVVDAQATMTLPEFFAADVMQANGISRNTDFSTVTKLRYPVTATYLWDILYFPYLSEIDLTSNGFPIPSQDIRGISTIGGCPWNPSLRRLDLNNDTPTKGSVQSLFGHQALNTMLARGGVTKVRYYRGSMGSNVDAALAAYESRGITEFVPLPNEILVTTNFYAEGRIVNADHWPLDVTYQPNDTPSGHGGVTHVWKVIPKGRAGSFCIVYQKDYKFNRWDYPYLKMKVYTPDASHFASNDVHSEFYKNYRRLWLRMRNYMWSSSNTPRVPWDDNVDEHNHNLRYETNSPYYATDAQLGTWREISWNIWDADLYSNAPTMRSSPYMNVMVINIGGEPTWPSNFTFNPAKPIVYYFADIRFSKTP